MTTVSRLHIPDRAGGWWHEYVCPVHGLELLPAHNDSFPCPYGCVLTGEPYSGAWAVLAHQAAALSLRRLAAAGEADRDTAIDGLLRYADLYRRLGSATHPDAQPWMLSGRLFQQALTEAIWGTSIAHAVQTLAAVVDHKRLQPILELLRNVREGARESRQRLVDRGDFRHNYTAWLNAAGASASRALALLGEVDETSDWITGRYGVADHAAAAIHEDGWEWEGSTYYHVFVLRAYFLAVRDCPQETLPAGLRKRLDDMLTVVSAIANDNGVLPALHDTPYSGSRWDDEIRDLWLMAGKLPDADRASRLFPDVGYAVLAGSRYRAILDYGPHGGSHGHLDKLSLYLYGPTVSWQPAYGVPPYAHPLKRGYYRQTAAHPTLTVDGEEQREATGQLLYWRSGLSTVVGASADVYDGVRFERHVRADPDQLIDVVRVTADRDRDFVLHLRTDVDAQSRLTADGYQTYWPGDDGLTGQHVSIPAAPITTGPDLGPADDPQRTRPHLRWQVTGRQAVFVSVYGAEPVDLRVEQDDERLIVHIGQTVHWVVPAS